MPRTAVVKDPGFLPFAAPFGERFFFTPFTPMTNKLTHNWRSSVAGLALILSSLAHVHSPLDLLKTEVLGALAGGIGLIVSADARKAGSDDAPQK
jgi:hypothetical protein